MKYRRLNHSKLLELYFVSFDKAPISCKEKWPHILKNSNGGSFWWCGVYTFFGKLTQHYTLHGENGPLTAWTSIPFISNITCFGEFFPNRNILLEIIIELAHSAVPNNLASKIENCGLLVPQMRPRLRILTTNSHTQNKRDVMNTANCRLKIWHLTLIRCLKCKLSKFRNVSIY